MTLTQRKILLETGVYAKLALDQLDSQSALLGGIKEIVNAAPVGPSEDQWAELRKLVDAYRP